MSTRTDAPAGRSQDDLRPFLAALAALIEGYYRLRHGEWLAWPLVTAAVLVALFSLVPRTMAPLSRLVMAAVRRIGRVNNFIVLSVLFYLVLTPAGFVMRLLQGDRFQKRPRRELPTYWNPRPDKGRDIKFGKMY